MTLETATTFKFAQNMLPRLVKKLLTISKIRKQQLDLISDTFGDPLLWAPYYIEPYCQQFNPADFDDESRHLVRELLTSRLQHFLGGKKSVSTPHLLVLADAGMGKTSCLMMLKLAHMNSFWPPSHDVELLKLGSETLNQIKSLEKKRTVLLLDALDEDPLAWGRVNERLTEILNATKNFQRVIITCRTQFFSLAEDPFDRRGLVEVGGYSCPAVFLSLFDELQVTSFLAKRFPGQIGRQQQAAKIIKSMHSLKFRPMLLSHIEELMESKSTNWTMHTLYRALVQAWLNRERKKMIETRNAKDVPELKDLYKACVSLARIMFQKNTKTISIDQIDWALVFDSEIGHLSKMDIAGRSLLNKNSLGEFRFSHFSIQEFLFAQAIFLGQIKFTQKREYRPTVQVMQFFDLQIRTANENVKNNIRLDFLDFNGLRLNDVDLSRLNMSEVLFYECSIVDSMMIETNLKLAEIVDSKFINVDLSLTAFSNGQIRDSTLQKCILNSSSARGVSISRTLLDAVNLHLTNITGGEIRDATFKNCILNSTIADYISISGSTFKKTDFSDSKLRSAKIIDSNFQDSEFVSTIADGISINNTVFNEANFLTCSLRSAKIYNSKFFISKFKSAIFEHALLQDTLFENCNFSNIDFDVSTVTNCKFIDCVMFNSKMSPKTAKKNILINCSNRN